MLTPEQNGCHTALDIYKYIFLKDKFCTLIQISPKFVIKCTIENVSNSSLVMAWYLTGDKPVPDPMLTQIYHTIWCYQVTRS